MSTSSAAATGSMIISSHFYKQRGSVAPEYFIGVESATNDSSFVGGMTVFRIISRFVIPDRESSRFVSGGLIYDR